MTKLSFIRKGRQPRRNNGGVSSGKKGKQEERLFEQASSTDSYSEERKSYEYGSKERNFLNFK